MTRIRIGSVSLDLRGVSPDVARSVGSLVGPAVARALAARSAAEIGSSPRLDAGSLTIAPDTAPHDIADRIATRVAASATGAAQTGTLRRGR